MPYPTGILFAIRAGVDSIEHTSLIDDEGFELARKNGTFLSVNAYTPIYMMAKGEEMGMLPESVEKARKLADKRLANYRKAIKKGAKIVYGSDSATYPHGDNAKQFSVYVDLGMSPMQAIQSATTVAAGLYSMFFWQLIAQQTMLNGIIGHKEAKPCH